MASIGAHSDSHYVDTYSLSVLQGAIGLESMSRGCEQAHFVECDAWTIRKCLKPNIDTANFQSSAVVHSDRVEDFLKRSTSAPSLAGGPFDFVSVTPPYMAVSYEEIYDLLESSPLVSPESVVMVEYSKQNKKDIRSSIGPLQLVKDRKYGRTFLAIYAAES
jgi:16S rRNA (guanine(966)-N(2))-methyltransferase RsmD